MKRLPEIDDVLRDGDVELTRVVFYFSYREADEWYDPIEGNKSIASVNLNPLSVKLYVTSVSPEKMFYKQYGQHASEGKMIICDKKYRSLFVNSEKIKIEGNEYTTYNKAVGSNVTIMNRNKNMISVVIYRK